MDFFKTAFHALPVAVTNLYGLIAYGLTVISWLIIAYRVKRNNQILKNITNIPEKDRLTLLKIEIGGVHLKEGLSAEEWLKYHTKKYFIIGYAITLITILLVLVITTIRKPSNPIPQKNSIELLKKQVNGEINVGESLLLLNPADDKTNKSFESFNNWRTQCIELLKVVDGKLSTNYVNDFSTKTYLEMIGYQQFQTKVNNGLAILRTIQLYN